MFMTSYGAQTCHQKGTSPVMFVHCWKAADFGSCTENGYTVRGKTNSEGITAWTKPGKFVEYKCPLGSPGNL